MGRKGKENNGWFVGYAPRRNPEIVVAALVQGSTEHGGTTAGPIVRDIVKAYYDKRNAHFQQQATVENVSPPTRVAAPIVVADRAGTP